MLDAASALIRAKGDEFTTQELAAEAGVALQTFYRYFASKDELLLAVIGDAMADACEGWALAAAEMPDPLARLRYLRHLRRWNAWRRDSDERRDVAVRGVDTLAIAPAVPHGTGRGGEAVRRPGARRGQQGDGRRAAQSDRSEWDSWFVAELARSVYHYYAFADHTESELDLRSRSSCGASV